jgi:hypothetical protein
MQASTSANVLCHIHTSLYILFRYVLYPPASVASLSKGASMGRSPEGVAEVIGAWVPSCATGRPEASSCDYPLVSIYLSTKLTSSRNLVLTVAASLDGDVSMFRCSLPVGTCMTVDNTKRRRSAKMRTIWWRGDQEQKKQDQRLLFCSESIHVSFVINFYCLP